LNHIPLADLIGGVPNYPEIKEKKNVSERMNYSTFTIYGQKNVCLEIKTDTYQSISESKTLCFFI
jgi:hypothetical protein